MFLIHLIDEGERLALLHAPFKGTTLFGGELVKLQEANTKCAATFAVFPTPMAPPVSYTSRLYVGRGNSFSDRRGSRKPSNRGRGQGRSTLSATSTRPGQSKEGQATLTVSVPQDSNKVKWSHGTIPLRPPRKNKHNFYSNVFLLRKASGGWRPVIDLKSLNAHIHAPHFVCSLQAQCRVPC